METKILKTLMHPILEREGEYNFLSTTLKRVAEVKLVLVECKPDEALLFKYQDSETIHLFPKKGMLVKGLVNYLKPILISKAEKIEVDNLVLGLRRTSNKSEIGIASRLDNGEVYIIPDSGDGFYCDLNKTNKILVLPEYFSSIQLKDIVDGKLKNSDKVLVECEDSGEVKVTETDSNNKPLKFNHLKIKQIKLNESNHITLYVDKSEEKMVSVSLLEDYIHQRMKGITNDLDFNLGGKAAYESILKWVTQNAK